MIYKLIPRWRFKQIIKGVSNRRSQEYHKSLMWGPNPKAVFEKGCSWTSISRIYLVFRVCIYAVWHWYKITDKSKQYIQSFKKRVGGALFLIIKCNRNYWSQLHATKATKRIERGTFSKGQYQSQSKKKLTSDKASVCCCTLFKSTTTASPSNISGFIFDEDSFDRGCLCDVTSGGH